MRLIGHLPDEADARTFIDYLYTEGITSQLEVERGGQCGIWVHEEDLVAKSETLLRAFLTNSKDPQFQQAAKDAIALRTREQEQNKEAARRHFESEEIFRDEGAFGMGRVTLTLIGISIAAFVVQWRADEWITKWFFISNESVGHLRLRLPEVRHQGQIWRLVTPIFLHVGIFHIFFNMLWLRELGTMIEARKGSLYLLGLVLAMSVIPNVAQYWAKGPAFVGMSGVVYGLLGYIWMMSKFDPGSGFFIHPTTVVWMLVWFVVCFIPSMGVANYVHGFGLGTGIVWGYSAATRLFGGNSSID